MLGQSLPEYIFILSSISLLRLVAPLSFLYLSYCLYTKSLTPCLFLFALLEASFYLFVYRPRKHVLQKSIYTPPPLTRAQRHALFLQCSKRIAGSRYPLGWFTSPNIKRQNVVEWILWALFSATPETAQESWEEEMEEYVTKVEELLGMKLEQGRIHTTSALRLTLDPVKMVHRPLIWYLVVALVDLITSLKLSFMGFTHYSNPSRIFPPRLFHIFTTPSPSATTHFSYWYRPHKSPTRDPIIFIHGIGIGLYPYLPFFQDLITATPDQGLLLIELLPISMHISSPPANSLPPVKSLLHGLYTTLDSLGISRAVLASHSYGTVLAAHVLRAQRESQQQDQPPRIHITSHLLIDPIPFLLHLPSVAFNFLYRPPRAANEWQLWYFASRDPDIAYVLGRCFFWAENVLWREDLGLDSGLDSESGKDQIIPAPLVRLYLTREDDVKPRWESQSQSHNRKLEVLYYPDLDHATVFDTKERRRGMVEVLGRFSVR
ncbi:uncharacterized protein C8R40DRAFT_1032949 [Lentinula edodes]|uniref:uncharacterized protein n=1 Tax=Lentinula edodes TaxID=5353 RepID=UPI001E8DB5C7|nr:uncharacterized protein C8R40DRAFT_1032949 [Lentinula edodes]KAH7880325.1 hypothetical protein C8R40DRAFT_1032949 [Lentinula edodes]